MNDSERPLLTPLEALRELVALKDLGDSADLRRELSAWAAARATVGVATELERSKLAPAARERSAKFAHIYAREASVVWRAALRRLVDLTWQHVSESLEVPSHDAAETLIEAALSDKLPKSRPGFDESWREGSGVCQAMVAAVAGMSATKGSAR
jgi:hypothetical protein